MECTFSSDGVYTFKLKVKDDEGAWSSWRECKVYVADVVSLEWETYPDDVVATPVDHGPNIDIDADVHPCQPPGSTAKRIFPGKKVYNDTLAERNMRQKVLAKVTISNTFTDIPDPGFPIWIELHDVDDPSANDYGLPEAQCTAPLDCDDPNHSAFSSFEDNKGGMEYRFSFTNGWDCDCGYVASGSDDVGIVMLTSRLPGNNVRVVAGTTWNLDVWDEVTWERVDSDSGAGLPSQVERSDMLTSWRKLHIDQDSMNYPGFGEGELNYVEGDNATYDPFVPSPPRTDVHLGLQLPGEFRYENQFQNGEYEVIGGNSYPVRNSHLDDTEDWIVVTGDPCGDGPLPPCSYKLRDDDNDLLVPSYPDLGTFALEFHKAYIDVDFLIQARDRLDFDRNMPKAVITENGAWNAWHTFFNSDDYWAAFMLVAFQAEVTKDADPLTDPGVCGITRWTLFGGPHTRRECVIFCETISDNDMVTGHSVEKSMAHELGHTGGSDDDKCEPGCIMYKNPATGVVGDHFCNQCLNRFRGYGEEW